MEVTLLLLGLLLFILLSSFLVVKKSSNSSAPPPSSPRLPPGPWQLPLVGSLHHLLLSRHGGDLPHRTLRDLSATHGPLMMLRLGAVPTLVVSSAEAAREVMKTHDAAFASRHQTPTLAVFGRDGRDILFSPYGDLWRQLRRLCVLELFSARRVQSFRRVREEEAGNLLRSVAACGAEAVVDVGEMICRAMNDSVVRSAVGSRCPRRDEFLRELNRAIEISGGFNLADLYPSSKAVRALSAALREAVRCDRNLRSIIAEIIRDEAVDVDQEEDHLLAVLLRLQKDGDAQGILTTEIITTLIMEIFSAGSETSSTTLEWAMSELVRNPRVMQKAQAEVREAFKGKHKLSEADMEKLSYLPLVIKETMRLHIPVPFLLPRVCRETCRVMGYDIPEGTKVLINAWAIARDDKYWDDPEVFKPERFETSNVDFKGADFEFIPFGAGRRMCPGMALGLVNMELALASLLYHFDWTLPNGESMGELDMSEMCGITVERKSKLVLCATVRIPLMN
ncbi:hypothetical protein EJB05_05801, partial [Eragrostis curvula]